MPTCARARKARSVVYANSITKTDENDAGEKIEREIHFLKGYTVFNVEQSEGLPEQYYIKPEPKLSPVQRIESAEAFFAAIKADIRYRADRPSTPSRTTKARVKD